MDWGFMSNVGQLGGINPTLPSGWFFYPQNVGGLLLHQHEFQMVTQNLSN